MIGVYKLIDNDISFSIFPNPITNEGEFILNKSNDLFSTIEIYNSQGEIILWFGNVKRNRFTINRNDFVPGFYIARIITRKEKYYVVKFIVE